MRQELFYLKSRATRHKKTADSNSRRTSTGRREVGVLCAVAAAQIVAVRYFFSKDAASKGRMHGPGSMGVGGGVGVNAGTYHPRPRIRRRRIRRGAPATERGGRVLVRRRKQLRVRRPVGPRQPQ